MGTTRLIGLDGERATDPSLTGAKAAWLARARAAGLPVLPGVVVTAPVSRPYLELGADALTRRGSGGARLEVSQAGLETELASEVVAASSQLGDPLVVRSSSPLEQGAEWAGAFTSYLDVHPDEVPKAVTGCWASVFSVATLKRHGALGVEPGGKPMAVLIQRALRPDFGGVARLDGEDVVITAVKGSPAPLVQGWEPGVVARVSPNGVPDGGAALDLMGSEQLTAVAKLVTEAHDRLDANVCEWAIEEDSIYLLQVMRTESRSAYGPVVTTAGLDTPAATRLVRLTRRFPGPLGETLILPWLVGATEPPSEVPPANVDTVTALATARETAATLTAQVWGLPKARALTEAGRVLREIRGTDPQTALMRLESLRPPDPALAVNLLGLVSTVRERLSQLDVITWPELGWHLEPETINTILRGWEAPRKRQRIGFDRWEPFDAAVTIATGLRHDGTAAAPGVASGRVCLVPDSGVTEKFRPRDVIVARHPTPNLAPLLWDAAGLITTGGGPGAHLFESARALAIPAVCSVPLSEPLVNNPQLGVAVDGENGVVYSNEW